MRQQQYCAGSFADDHSWVWAFPENGPDHGVDNYLGIICPGFLKGAIHFGKGRPVAALLLPVTLANWRPASPEILRSFRSSLRRAR